MLEPLQERTNIDADDYTREIALMSTTWRTAQAKIKEAQKKQKHQHDKKAKDPQVFKGDRVVLYSPAEKCGKAYKFVRPFKGPYHVVKMLNAAELSLIGEPTGPTIRVALNHLRRCPKEILDGQIEQDTLEESGGDEIGVEESPPKDMMDDNQEESTAVVEPAQQQVMRRSTRLVTSHHRDVITKDRNM